MDCSTLCGNCYNHVSLINSVYPSTGETGPKSSALSLLLFYASSKPKKLAKIGNYLAKKVTADMARHKSRWAGFY